MPPTDAAELELVAKDVVYEIERLFQAARLFPETPERKGKRLILEALLLHFRNVIDFFYTDSQQSDDVRACHFFSDPTQWKPVVPDWYREYKTRCNKLLAHLTYSRIDFKRRNDMTWQLTDKLRHIRRTWELFLRSLPAERRAWFSCQI